MAKTAALGKDDLTTEGKLDPAKIDAVSADANAVAAALGGAQDPAHVAGLAIVAGLKGHAALAPTLVPMMKRDDVGGRAAAWALGRIDAPDLESSILTAIASGGVMLRENGYWALAVRAARGAASGTLADAIVARIDEELGRVKSGRVSVADRAIAVISVLGDPRTPDLARKILETDRSSDRVELHRIIKRFEQEKRDSELRSELTAPWPKVFRDHVYVAPAAEAPPSPLAANAPTPPKGTAPAPGKAAAPPPPAASQAPAQAGGPIDWAAFAKSPEATALPPQVRDFAPKVGGLLEQLAQRAIGAELSQLTGQELMALLVQVLPQSLPPQHVELALSPDALDAYEATMRFLARTGASTHGNELVAAVQKVRDVIEQQMMAPR